MLISSRSPRDTIDCSWCTISEPANACGVPWRVNSPHRIMNFNWFWTGIIESWKLKNDVFFLLLVAREVDFSKIVQSSLFCRNFISFQLLHLLVLNFYAKKFHFRFRMWLVSWITSFHSNKKQFFNNARKG